MKVYFGWRLHAGLLVLDFRWGCIHLLVQPANWIWGHEHEDYDDLCEYYGLGPLLLIVVDNWTRS